LVSSDETPMNFNIIYNNTIKVISSSSVAELKSTGILLNNADSSNISLTTINATASNAYATDIYLVSGSDNNFGSDNNLLGRNWSIYLDAGGGTNNTFVNASYNGGEFVGSSAQLIRKWYLDTNTTNQDMVGIEGVNVTSYNSSSVLQKTGLTNSLGVLRQELIGYVNLAGVKTYYSNYTTNVTKIGYSSNSSSFNLTGNKELSLRMTDLVSPTIILVSPADESQRTSANTNFQFNVSDESTVANCWVYYTGGSSANTIAINKSLTNEINVSLSSGTYNWSVNCTDSAGNIGNSSTRSFTITLATAAIEKDSPSSGGGTPVYSITESNLQDGYSKQLYTDWKLSFKSEGISHQLKLNSFSPTNKTATITISSNPQTRTLFVGEEWKVNLNSDNFYDLLVRLNNISFVNANIFIKEINETIVPEVKKNETKEVYDVGENKDENKNNYVLIAEEIVLALILLCVAFFIAKIYLRFRRRKRGKYLVFKIRKH
jgi:hypothetical protein